MLYQQGTQRIEVIVRKDGGGGVAGARTRDASDVSNETRTTAQERRRKRIIKTNATHAFATARQLTNLAKQYAISGIGYRTGDQALQDQIGRQVERFNDVESLASSVSMGITYGSWGGPVGAALGAVFALATTGGSLMSKYETRERDYNYKIFKENNAIEYNRARAGINAVNGRLR